MTVASTSAPVRNWTSSNRLWSAGPHQPAGQRACTPRSDVDDDGPGRPQLTMNEASLSTRFSEGHPTAIREVYTAYERPVFAVAYRVLQDRGLAEEAVQHTFLQAWRAAGTFDARRELAPWLYTIARRAAVDLYRRERRHRADELGDRDIAILPATFEGTWAAWEVRRALDSLPKDEHAVLHVTHFEGLTHVEAAKRLGIPVGTVKSRSYRAYRRLAGLLAHLEEVTA